MARAPWRRAVLWQPKLHRRHRRSSDGRRSRCAPTVVKNDSPRDRPEYCPRKAQAWPVTDFNADKTDRIADKMGQYADNSRTARGRRSCALQFATENPRIVLPIARNNDFQRVATQPCADSPRRNFSRDNVLRGERPAQLPRKEFCRQKCVFAKKPRIEHQASSTRPLTSDPRPLLQNCDKNASSFAYNSRMSSMPNRAIVSRSIPMPNANPWYASGSSPPCRSTSGRIIPEPNSSIHRPR